MEKILSDFGIQPLLLAAQMVNFLVLLYILKRLLYKPILKVLDERKQRIAKSLKNAEEIEKKLNEITERQDAEILKATKEGENIIKQAKESGLAIIEESKLKAEDIAKRMIEEAKNHIQVEKEKLRQEIRENLADLVVMAMQKVTGKILNKKDQKEMINKTIKTL